MVSARFPQAAIDWRLISAQCHDCGHCIFRWLRFRCYKPRILSGRPPRCFSGGSMEEHLLSTQIVILSSPDVNAPGTGLKSYSSRATFTVISAVTSRCRRTVTLCSPSVRIGSSRLILRRSTL
jgi:hypothetical protein